MRTKKAESDPVRIFVGIDNGVSGSIGIIAVSAVKTETNFVKMPTFNEQSYTKQKRNLTRVDTKELTLFFSLLLTKYLDATIQVVIENPMINPTRFRATTSALRALEATLIVVESFDLPRSYIYSKEWQKAMLPSGIKGAAESKKASKHIGCRLFPQHKELIETVGDADGLLIAEYVRKTY